VPAGKRAATPLERAGALVDQSGETPWDARSRFGVPGLWARRLLLRLIRPYAVRQREVDRALLHAIRAQPATAPAAAEHGTLEALPRRAPIEMAAPLPEEVIEVETDVGSILLDATDTLITPLIREHSGWEADVVAFLRSSLAPGMTFIDIGAHVGYFTVLASGIVAPKGRVFAVEPEPRNLDLLRANLWRNGCDNVTVLPVAAHDTRGHIRFVSNPEGLAGSWIEPDQGENAAMVPCAPLDELLGDMRVDAIKIDIERSEPAAIRGAEGLIRTAGVLDIVAEFWPTHQYAGGHSPADVLAYYESLGLELRLLKPDGTTDRATAEQLLALGEQGPIANIVLSKR
jgi:FkbM family methyltransferase